jgi:Protein of unknown function (DUF2568)
VSPIQKLNLTLRVLLELSVVAALGYWGIRAGQSTSAKVLLGIGAPLVGFGLWGAVDFHRSRHGEMLRLVQELVMSGLAAAACYAAGRHAPAIALATLSIVYHLLVYASGARLLTPHDTAAKHHVDRAIATRGGSKDHETASGRASALAIAPRRPGRA